MCGWSYLLIRWSDLKTENIVMTIRISRSFLWSVMIELMHVTQRQIDACNASMILRVHGWSFKSFSLIKSWVQNWVSIEYPLLSELEKRMSM